MARTITIRDAHDRYALTIDRDEEELLELEAEIARLRKELRYKLRDLRQLRDVHELEAR